MAEDPLAEVIWKAHGDWYDLPDTSAPLPALTEFQAAAVRAHIATVLDAQRVRSGGIYGDGWNDALDAAAAALLGTTEEANGG